MNYLLRRQLIPLAVIAFASLASAQNQSQGPDLLPTSQIEIEAPQATVQEAKDHLTIQVGANKYNITPPADSLESLNSLSEDDKDTFRKNRSAFLAQAAKALQVMKYGFGVGSVAKEKISYVFQHLRDESALRQLKTLPAGARDDAQVAWERGTAERAQEAEQKAQITFKERSGQVVESFLNALDRTLWSQALLFAHSNEFGIVASGGLEFLGGIQDKGGWGGLFDVGLSIGYNRDTKSVAIQIFRDFEKFKSTSMKAVFVAGVVGKAGMYIANQRTGEMTREGSSFYPPMIPAYSSTTKSSFQTGMSSGLTWPPSPLGDMLTYTNSLDSKVMLRITLSPLLKGFVRLETGFNRQSLMFWLSPIQAALTQIKKITSQKGAMENSSLGSGSCNKVFAN